MSSADWAEAGRIGAAAFLGIAVTDDTSIIRMLIAFATLAYMTGKAALIWRNYMKARKGQDVKQNCKDDI